MGLTLTKRSWNKPALIQPSGLPSSHTSAPPTLLGVMHIQLYELSLKYNFLPLARICYAKQDCTKPIHSLARFSGPTSITFNSTLRVAAITCPAPPTSLGVMHIQLYELSPKYNFFLLVHICYAKQDCTKPNYSLTQLCEP